MLVSTESDHYLIDSIKYWRVTYIIGCVKQSAGLEFWRQKVGDYTAELIKNYSASYGQHLHTLVGRYLEGYDSGKLIEVMFSDIKESKVIYSEKLLYSADLPYAGTADIIYLKDAKWHLLDIKSYNSFNTSKKKIPDSNQKTNYFYQLGAYATICDKLGITIEDAEIRFRLGTGGWCRWMLSNDTLNVYKNRWNYILNNFLEVMANV